MLARILLALLGGGLLASEAPMTVYVVDSLERVGPKDAPGALREAWIKAARNEYEAVQVVVRSGANGLQNIRAEVTDLAGLAGKKLDRRHIALYREHFVEIKSPSPKSSMSPGFVPDALIPFQGPVAPPLTNAKIARFCAIPFSLRADTNQPLWVEVHVPKEAAPGDYLGKVTVSAAGQDVATVPLKLTVWDFALPDRPSLRTYFGGLGRRLLTGHPGYKPDTLPYRTLELRYAAAMVEHRLCPPIPPYLRPKVGPDGAIDAKFSHPGLKRWMDTFHVTGLPIELLGEDPTGVDRGRNLKFLTSMWAYLKENGWDKIAYVHALEDSTSAKGYEEVRRRAKLIREAAPGLKVLCGEPPVPENPSWGSLVGSVDIWVPPWPAFEAQSVAERRNAGDEVWTQTTQCQGKPGLDTPFWELDFPLLNYRIPAWISRRFGLSGLFYWTMVFWPETDVWMDPKTYEQYNDEGCLFYPGADAGLEGPVPSLRLKALRDGLEDYEYLVLAGEAGTRVAEALAQSWTRWNKDPSKLASAREELSRLILERKK